jgi:predicted nuclease with TOPRIM domain
MSEPIYCDGDCQEVLTEHGRRVKLCNAHATLWRELQQVSQKLRQARDERNELYHSTVTLKGQVAHLNARLATAWDGLKVTNEQLCWALKELGPTGTNAEAYVKAAVEYVINKRP